ncbi:YhdP family protein [Crenobacter sp. SG2303]|uniref:YhdP family protein n=1 Tax=Crenobacter oryzisoli TaxID=3056844 RepID=A0ABT7XS01_9NEIS|nr:YhdP family protein [Crenobacter sp. SG2303]MDN0076577.1 YhdP family protein [Crenobacter sp. SG2303]
MEKLLVMLGNLPVLRVLKLLLRLTAWLLGSLVVILTVAFAVFSFWFLPRLDTYRPDLESMLSQATGRTVRVGSLSGHWAGVAPILNLKKLELLDPRGGAPLTLAGVALKPSWWSLVAWEPRFSLVELDTPRLEIVRDPQRHLSINGMQLSDTPSDGHLVNWLLQQGEVRVDNAKLVWRDNWLALPPMELSGGQLVLSQGLLGHQLAISGETVRGLGQNMEFNASWHGSDVREWRQWTGQVSLELQKAQAGPWSRYLAELGSLASGQGQGKVTLGFAGGVIIELSADVRIFNATFTPAGASQMVVPDVSGKLTLKRQMDGAYLVNGEGLTLVTTSGVAMQKANLKGRIRGGANGLGELTLDNAHLAALTPLLRAFQADRNPLIGRLDPQGTLTGLSASWEGPFDAPHRYRLATEFKELGWAEIGGVPGVVGASGKVTLSEKGGQLTLDNGKSEVMLSHLFAKPLHFERLAANLDWTREAKGTTFNIRQLQFADAVLAGSVEGQYRYTGKGAGLIDLSGSIDRVAAAKVVDYLPYQVGEKTLSWLRGALLAGEARNARFVLKGDLDRFPFQGGKGGEFIVDTDLDNVSLHYETGWPEVKNINGSLHFHNEQMVVNGTQGNTVGVPVSDVVATIADLGADTPVLTLTGKVKGPLQQMLGFTTQSPVDGWLGGFTSQLKGGGNAELALKLEIPLHGPAPAKVRGDIQFAGNRLGFGRFPIPEADKLAGVLTFTEHGVESRGLTFDTLGGRFRMTANTDADARMHFALDGVADTRAVFNEYVPPLARFVDGRSVYQVRFAVRQGLENLTVNSTLQGSRLTAPAPADKPAESQLPFSVTVKPDNREATVWSVGYALDGRSSGMVKVSDKGELAAGTVAVGTSPGVVPAHGLAIRVATPSLDLGPWLDLSKSHKPASGNIASLPLTVDVAADTLSLDERRLNEVKARVASLPGGDGWHVDLLSRELSGQFDYLPAGNGMVRARLPRLDLPLSENLLSTSASKPAATASGIDLLDTLPALDVEVQRLRFRGGELGSLTMQARSDGSDWRVSKLSVVNPDGKLEGSLIAHGAGSGGAASHVDSSVTITSNNLGQLLGRFGEPGAVVNGRGSLDAKLSWPGRVADFSMERLSGTMDVDARDGRFAKLESGVARLLGVISLQSLPRRIKLDFTDVFSSGFAFDSIVGSAQVSHGVFRSDNLAMKGPGADVKIAGEVDLVAEQQKLKVRVTPHLSEGVAIAAGVALLNPVIGVAALAAQKVLQDPVSKIFSLDYAINGSLTDPKVTKLGGTGSIPSKGATP